MKSIDQLPPEMALAELTTKREGLWLADFATVFAHMWYRDFPLQYSVHEKAQRADWTTHIGIAVRSTADLMGLFTHFESGGRTDAVLRDSKGAVVAALEWEWAALHRGPAIINEFDKLKCRCADRAFEGIRFAGLIGYARESSERDRDDYTQLLATVLEHYKKSWVGELAPLLLVVIHYKWMGKHKTRQSRQFTQMTIDKVAGGGSTRLREQPAYPWDVIGSRWAQETKST
jgi:hypothetical protein